jgi:hypothetical protein
VISKTDGFYFILPDETGRQILLLPTDGGWTLPYCEVAVTGDSDLMDTGCFNKAAREQFGLNISTLYALDTMETKDAVKIAAFENHDSQWEPPRGARWIARNELDGLVLVKPIMKPVLETWFADIVKKSFMPWSKMGWFDEAAAWMVDQIQRLRIKVRSPVEQVKSFYTGGTLRVNTDQGYIYFKNVSHVFIRELEITRTLARWFPERVPTLLAVDPERRWMLVRDIGGVELSEVPEFEVWEYVLRVYAQMQIASLKFIDELLDGVFYDYRLQTMASTVDSVIMDLPSLLQGYQKPLTDAEATALRSLSPRLKALCAEVGSYGVPCTVAHGDLHSGNIRLTKDGPVFYDWAWSCVTHPFLGPSGLLYKASKWSPAISNVQAQLRDVYLKAWTAYEPMERLRELFSLIKRWAVLHAVLIDAEWVAAYQKELSHRAPLPYSFIEWSLRRRQYYLAKVARRLLEREL